MPLGLDWQAQALRTPRQGGGKSSEKVEEMPKVLHFVEAFVVGFVCVLCSCVPVDVYVFFILDGSMASNDAWNLFVWTLEDFLSK